MDSTLLDKEKFDALKELGVIQTKIAECSAVLSSIQAETDAYILERENKVIARIEALYVASKDALSEIQKNHKALTLFKNEVSGSHESLSAILLVFKQFREEQEKVTALGEQQLEDKAKQLEDIRNVLAGQRAIIEADAQAVRAERKWLEEERIRVNDQRETLQRAFNRMTNKTV